MAESSSSQRLVGAAGFAAILAVGANMLDGDHAKRLDNTAKAAANGTLLLDVKMDDGALLSLNHPSVHDKARLDKIIQDGEYNLSYSNEVPVYPYSHILVRDRDGHEICTIRLEARTLGKLVQHNAIDLKTISEAKSVEDLAAVCGIKPEEVRAMQVSGVQQLDRYIEQLTTAAAAPQLAVTNVTLGSARIADGSDQQQR